GFACWKQKPRFLAALGMTTWASDNVGAIGMTTWASDNVGAIGMTTWASARMADDKLLARESAQSHAGRAYVVQRLVQRYLKSLLGAIPKMAADGDPFAVTGRKLHDKRISFNLATYSN